MCAVDVVVVGGKCGADVGVLGFVKNVHGWCVELRTKDLECETFETLYFGQVYLSTYIVVFCRDPIVVQNHRKIIEASSRWLG